MEGREWEIGWKEEVRGERVERERGWRGREGGEGRGEGWRVERGWRGKR